MSEWWTYSPTDFLLFSPRVYYRLIELNNGEVWPLQAVAALIGLALVLHALRPGRFSGRTAAVALGIAWAWVGWSFLWLRYAEINWAMTYVAPFFALQGILLILTGVLGGGLNITLGRDPRSALGLALVVLALAGYPLIAPALGRPWLAGELFGITADPTAAATLALLALSSSRLRGILAAIPLLWCLMTGTTLWIMKSPDYVAAPAIAVMALLIMVWRHRGISTERQ